MPTPALYTANAEPLDVMTVVGARPQFIKSGVVSAAFAEHGISEILVHTGQHFDRNMSDIFFDDLGLRTPDVQLHLPGGRHGEMTGRMLEALERVMVEREPRAVLVYGDTNSTLAGALAAVKLHVPVIHVEAGLRSFNRAMPEEVNRVLTDHVSALLMCPTTTAVDQLRREGITEGVRHVGDVMLDVARSVPDDPDRRSTLLARLDVPNGPYAVATIHRAENTDDGGQLARLVEYLRERALPVVLPLHPRTSGACADRGIRLDGIHVVAPLGYIEMTLLVRGASEVLTDSGGLQKEAYFHGVPCVTLRDGTEWTETIAAGWNRLWTEPTYKLPRTVITEFGSGQAASAIARSVVSFLADA